MGEHPGQHLWGALESVRGLCTSNGAWRELLAGDYGRASKFLLPVGRLARSYPCPARPECGCIHRVVRRADDRITGACECEPRRCPSQPLARESIALLRVDIVALGAAVASMLDCPAQVELVRDLTSTWRVGAYSPFEGIRVPVYLTAQAESDALRREAEALVARATGVFLLLVPTRRLVDSAIEDVLSRAGACVVALSEEFDLTEVGTIAARRPIDHLLKPLHDRVVPRGRGAATTLFFPTPAGASWPEVKLKFKDGETVSVRVGSASGVFTYTQMGMVDAKSGRPSKQWDLLRAFAIRHGYLDWTSGDANRKNQKRKEILAKDLRAFFRIEAAPFELTASEKGSGKGWRTRFALDPE